MSSVISLLALKYAIEKNIKWKKPPRSVKRQLTPFDMLVSSNIKIMDQKKDKRKPKGKYNNLTLIFYYFKINLFFSMLFELDKTGFLKHTLECVLTNHSVCSFIKIIEIV